MSLCRLFYTGQTGVQLFRQKILAAADPGAFAEPCNQKSQYAQLFIKRRALQLTGGQLIPGPVQNVIHVVDLAVFGVQFQIVCKVLGDAGAVGCTDRSPPGPDESPAVRR